MGGEKIEQVLVALRTGKRMPVERVPPEIIVKDLRLLMRAHGFHRMEDLKSWLNIVRPKYFDLRGIPLPNCELKNADFRFAYLEGADLSGCKLINANLTGANLRGANLSGAILYGSKLDHAVLNEADLSGAKFNGASLIQALFYKSTIVRTDFSGANLEGAQFADIILALDKTILRAYQGTGEMMSALNFTPANLSKSNFGNANLSGAIFGSANLGGTSFFQAGFSNTLIDVSQLKKAINYRYIKPTGLQSKINVPNNEMRFIEAYHRELKRFFASIGMRNMEAEYHFWEQEAKTRNPESSLYNKVLRLAFLKWPYGYGSRPIWLLYYSFAAVLGFTTLYVLLSISKQKSGVCRVEYENGQESVIPLSWRKGFLIADCFYFSLLSLATFSYGVLKPRQWIEFFRFEPIELRPIGWARILVGLEAAVGIYLLALLTIVLFGKG